MELAGILAGRYKIGHLRLRSNSVTEAPTVASMSLHRQEIRQAIMTIVPGFQPPKVNQNYSTVTGGEPPTHFSGEAVERTLADLLWSSYSNEAFAAMQAIFKANLQASGLTFGGLNGLGRIFSPFSAISHSILEPANVDYNGQDFQPLLVEDTERTKAILEMGGLTRFESSEQFKPGTMQAGYLVHDKTIVTDWDNAISIRDLLSWATGVKLSFLPHYQSLSSLSPSNCALSVMNGVIKACELTQSGLALFWVGKSAQYDFPHVYADGGHVDLRRTSRNASILLTVARENTG